MAIQRKTGAQTVTAILEIMGYSASTKAPWSSDANLYIRINEYLQSIPMRMQTVARELAAKGLIPVSALPFYHPMYKSSATSATSGTGFKIAASSSTAYLPVDYDHYISCYDITNKRPVSIIEEPDRFLSEELLKLPAGPPRYLELHGYALDSSDWRRSATIHPSTVSGVTPSMRLSYHRVPAKFDGTGTDYADIAAQNESIVVDGTITLLARNTGFEYDRFAQREKEALVEMILGAMNA